MCLWLIFTGDLRNDNDANCTYEGENNILIQQASNFLINTRAKGWAAFNELTPSGVTYFFKDGEAINRTKWTWKKVDCVMKPESKTYFPIALS